jgi:carboxymethylenebutenolidase
MIEYAFGDDVALGYLALPGDAKGPAVLLLHPWWGLNAFMKGFADRLAGEGFVVLAPDLYDGRVATTIEEAEQAVSAVDPGKAAWKAAEATQYLRSHERTTGTAVGLVGFSYGASWALWLAENRPSEIGATVIFYGTGDQDFVQARSAFLGHFAASDPYESLSWVREMEKRLIAAGRPTTFYFYPGTGHWFFESDRPDAYHPYAAQLAWERTLAFLKQHLR